ncbi:MAG: hypothetical protein ABS49_10355 [Erythrobacter sp. SCN 62-14]|nr:MAG: hypothetical protein ABS49_10355 [Erythrobacter sp. SCN 62-14]
MKLRYLLAASVVSLAATTMVATPVFAQETTSSVRGSVVDADGNAVPGASVTVTHQPSGTRSELTTDAGGNFNASGLRLGGPFVVSVTAPGFESVEEEIGFLTAGQAQRVSIALAPAGQTIVVSGSRQRSAISLATGAATVLSARDVFGVANVDRSLQNLAQRDPLVTVQPGGQGIQIAGQNNRFNRFTVDGVDFSDPFGLEAGGLVSTRGPVPLDAIGEFSVEVAPVDIQQGNFLGGAINTQLKSGGNEFTFLGAAFYQDDALRGTRSRGRVIREGAFESQIFTAQVTGPIIKDKLFFAVTYERTRDTVPADVSPAQLGITDAQLDLVNGIANNTFGFDTLGVANDILEKDDKLITKLDWNVAPGHRISATYIWNEGSVLAGQIGINQIQQVANGSPIFNLLSNNYTQGAVNHFGVIQSNNQWTDSFATMLRVSYADYVRLQVPIGGNRDFGQFQVCLAPQASAPPLVCPPGNPRLNFGPDPFRQANELNSQRLAVEFAATLKMNNHTVKFITERRMQDVFNLFAPRVSGTFFFDGLDDFANQRANQLVFDTPLRGDLNSAAAIFANNQWTFGIQDTIDVADNLTIVAGMRYDLFDSPDRPAFNQFFFDRFGFPNTANLNGRDLFQPRFGINWRASDRLTVRGSAGIFGGGNPLVWISNNYTNPGPTLGSATVNRNADGTFTINGVTGLTPQQTQQIGAAALNNVTGGPGIPAELINALQGGGAANATTNSLDPNFRPQSQWRFSGSADYTANLGALGDDWNFGVDLIYSKVRDSLEWTDIRSVPVGTLPDGRRRYAPLPGQAGVNTDIFLTNATLGDSLNVVARFNKRWNSGFYLNGAYTYQQADDVNSGTSSQAISNRINAAAADPNFSAFGTSIYQTDHQFRLTAGFDGEIFGDNNTRVELFYIARSGQRFSYTFNDLSATGNDQRSDVFGVTGRSDRNLMYVPDVSSPTADPRVVYAPGFDFAAFQNFIQNSELAGFQGQIAPKNLGQAPWWHNVDLSIRQQVPFVRGGKVELFADVQNVLNLIDSELGSFRQVGFPGFVPVVNVSCADADCTQYLYSSRPGGSIQQPAFTPQPFSSLWGVRFGIRVAF